MTTASVVGLGKLGAPLLAVLARQGFDVVGIDLNPQAVAQVADGIAPVAEPGLQSLLTAHGARIRATSDWRVAIGGSDVTYLLVPTPSGADGGFKNDHLFAAVEEIGRVLRTKRGYHLVVISSTVMPGSVGGPIRERLEQVSGRRVGGDLGLCYNPEFVALGNVIDGLIHPDFVLIGESDARAGAMLEGITRRIVGDKVPIARMNFVNAELTKIAVNTYITMKISFANSLSEICDNLAGADVDAVTGALGKDARIGGKYLRGATGYGGPCFPRDTVAFAELARQAGTEANLALAAHTINERQVGRIAAIVTRQTSPGDCVAVLGLAYKPDTPVTEQAQGILLTAALATMERRVIVHDPLGLDVARSVLGSGIEFAASVADAVAAADAIIIMIPSAEYIAFFAGWSGAGSARLVVDCWRILDPARCTETLRIMQLGRAPDSAEDQGPCRGAFSR